MIYEDEHGLTDAGFLLNLMGGDIDALSEPTDDGEHTDVYGNI